MSAVNEHRATDSKVTTLPLEQHISLPLPQPGQVEQRTTDGQQEKQGTEVQDEVSGENGAKQQETVEDFQPGDEKQKLAKEPVGLQEGEGFEVENGELQKKAGAEEGREQPAADKAAEASELNVVAPENHLETDGKSLSVNNVELVDEQCEPEQDGVNVTAGGKEDEMVIGGQQEQQSEGVREEIVPGDKVELKREGSEAAEQTDDEDGTRFKNKTDEKVSADDFQSEDVQQKTDNEEHEYQSKRVEGKTDEEEMGHGDDVELKKEDSVIASHLEDECTTSGENDARQEEIATDFQSQNAEQKVETKEQECGRTGVEEKTKEDEMRTGDGDEPRKENSEISLCISQLENGDARRSENDRKEQAEDVEQKTEKQTHQREEFEAENEDSEAAWQQKDEDERTTVDERVHIEEAAASIAEEHKKSENDGTDIGNSEQSLAA